MSKINVLQFICPTGFYGAELWILALMKHLDQRTVDCQLAITRESARQNIEICHRAHSLEFKSHQIRMSSRFDPTVIPKLVALIKREKVNIIHTHGYKSDLLGLIAARTAGIKAIATPHGFENVKNIKLQFFIRLGCLCFKHFDRIVPLSEELRSDIIRMKANPEKVQLIRNGVDLEEIESERKKAYPLICPDNCEKKIGYIGQMAFRKNIADLLKTFDLLYRAHKNIRLILIGDGPQKQELENKVKSMVSGSKIQFLGYRRDRLRLLKEFNLFSMTSSLEGIPRSLMEAMALEIPVVAYRIPGIDKLIIHERTGLMADFGHIEALKNCWERLLFNGTLAQEIARNGRRHIVENFSAQKMADEYTALYQEIISAS